ncbi:MAG: DUF4347 domain-containing protein, partial [Pseudomonadota bacterium]
MLKFADQIRGAASAWAINAFDSVSRQATARNSNVMSAILAAWHRVTRIRYLKRIRFGRTRRRLRRAINTLRRRWLSQRKKKNLLHPAPMRPQQRIVYRQLEPRMVFDGAAAATADAVVDDTPAPAEVDAAQAAEAESAADSDDLVQALTEPGVGPTGEANAIVFIDSTVNDIDALIAGVDFAAEFVIINDQQGALEQIADFLSDKSDISAIHIISHGSDGSILIGGETITQESLTQNAETVSAIGNAL